MQFHHLALERARRDPLAQALEAVHLGLPQAAPVIAAPRLPDACPQALACPDGLVSGLGSRTEAAPQASVPARCDHHHRAALRDRIPACQRVVGTVCRDDVHGFIRRNRKRQQLGQHRRVANRIARDLDRADLHRLRVDAQMHLAPLAAVLSPVLVALPLTLSEELDSRAVGQQLQGLRAGPIANLHLQRLLTPAHRAVVRRRPVQPRQPQQALHQPQRLPQGQPEQALDAQAELDRRVREGPLATALARGRSQPLHVPVQPQRQRPPRLQRRVVGLPVLRAVRRPALLGFAHGLSLRAATAGFVQQSHLQCERCKSEKFKPHTANVLEQVANEAAQLLKKWT